MPLNLDSLDDPMVQDACAGFAAGQISFGPSDQLPPNAFREGVNIDIRDGTATTRRGTSLVGTALAGQVQGMIWFDTPALEYLVAVANGVTNKWDESSWTASSGYVPVSTTVQVQIVQLIDKIYFADGTSHLFSWDGTTLVDLATGAGKPPLGNIIISAHNRIWMAGIATAPDTLARSAILDGATWDETNQSIRIGAGEGDPITALCELDEQQVVVFKRNSIYVVQASPATTSGTTPTTNFGVASIVKLSDTIGCVGMNAVVRVGRDIYFLSDAGIYSIGRIESQIFHEVKETESLPVHDIIDRINWSVATRVAAFFWDNRFFFSLPLDDETLPHSVLVYDVRRNAWCGLWTGWGPLCWALSKAGGQERVNFGRSDGAVWRWLDYVRKENEVDATFRDVSGDVASSVTTRAMIFADGFCRKSPLSVQPEFFASQAVVSLGLRMDENEEHVLNEAFATAPGELLLDFMLPATLPSEGIKRRAFGCQHLEPFRGVQAVLAAPAGKIALRAVLAEAFNDTILLEN